MEKHKLTLKSDEQLSNSQPKIILLLVSAKDDQTNLARPDLKPADTTNMSVSLRIWKSTSDIARTVTPPISRFREEGGQNNLYYRQRSTPLHSLIKALLYQGHSAIAS